MTSEPDRIHVLHVDDEPGLAETAAEFLERQDDRISTQTVTSAREGVEYLEDAPVDCIVSDYDMPGRDGIEFLETVREERPELPFILYTGKGSEEIASEAISAGVTDYLQKETGTGQYTVLANRIVNSVERFRADKQLHEVQERYRTLQEQLTELSISLLQTGSKEIDTKIDEALEKIGTLVTADRSYVFQINHEADTLSNTHEWCAKGIEPQIDMLQEMDLETFPWLLPKLREFENVTIPAVSELPPEAEDLQKLLQEQNIDSLILSPMRSDDTLVGFIGFDWVQEQDQWSTEFIDILRMAGQLITSALRRTDRERELAELKERLELALEAANLGVWDWDMETDEVYRDERWAGMLGYEPDEVGNRIADFEQLAHPADLESHDEALAAHVEGEVEFYTCEYRLQTAEGSWKWIQNLGKIIERDDDGEPVRSIGVHLDVHDRKQREIELERMTDLFEQAQEIAGLGAWETDLENEDGWWTEQVNQIYGLPSGYEPDPGEGIEYFHPADRPIIRDAFEQAMVAGKPYDLELRVEDGDGDVKWVRARGKPQFEDGEVVRVRGTLQDITARKKREQKLQRFASLFEHASDAIALIKYHDGTPVIREANPAFEATFAPDETIIGRDIDEVVASSERIEEARRISQRVRKGELKRQELTRDTVQGPRDFLWQRIPVEDPETGEIESVFAVYTDITERKEHERELERYQTLAEVAGDPMYRLDDEGHFTYVNDALVEITGYSKDDLLGEHVQTVVVEEHVDRGGDLISTLRTRGEQHGTFDVDLLTKTGKRIPAENHVSLLFSDEEFRGSLGVLRDITDRLERERKLQRERDRLDRFAGVVSHDLRNPLNVAMGRIELAMEECESEHLDSVTETLDRMETRIDDILTLARTGETVGETETIELDRLLDSSWRTVETESAQLLTDIDDAIHADETRLQQLFENLFRNAVEHGGDDVTVTVGELGDGFYIEDDGPGIPDPDREDVFEAGYSTHEGGSGFGLSIVKEIVQAHGWEIRATEGTEGGARFEITGVEFVAE